MIEFRNGDIFDSGCEALVNPVNCLGTMGKGLALAFAKRFPVMAEAFKVEGRMLVPGFVHLWRGDPAPVIINFPTKVNWRHPSEYEYIEKGLVAMDGVIQNLDLKSVAIPALGCGLGGLQWARVKEMIERSHQERWGDRLIAVYEPR